MRKKWGCSKKMRLYMFLGSFWNPINIFYLSRIHAKSRLLRRKNITFCKICGKKKGMILADSSQTLLLLLKVHNNNRAFQSVVFKSGQKMALRAFCFIRALTKALKYYNINRSRRHLLTAIENNWFGVPIVNSTILWSKTLAAPSFDHF